jgi:D-threo-aldose 1-dehydrogenase
MMAGNRTVAQPDRNLARFSHPIPASFRADLKARGFLRKDAPVPA